MTASAGIHFKHTSGAFGKKYLPETLGSGVAFLDADGDGWQDILFVNGRNWPGQPGSPSYPALYHNNGNGTFTDITRAAGLAVEMYGMGVSVADYDNDGDTDIYITALGPNHLFRNNGGGQVRGRHRAAGVGDPGFSTSAVWFDYDRDGKLDLFVGNYVEWSADKDLFCTLNGKTKSYCTPESYKGQSPTLYHNNRRRHLRERHAKGRPLRSGGEDARSRADRLRQRRAASMSSPRTTRSRIVCIATRGMGRSPMSASWPASRSTKRASRAPAWAPTRPTTTGPAGRA